MGIVSERLMVVALLLYTWQQKKHIFFKLVASLVNVSILYIYLNENIWQDKIICLISFFDITKRIQFFFYFAGRGGGGGGAGGKNAITNKNSVPNHCEIHDSNQIFVCYCSMM